MLGKLNICWVYLAVTATFNRAAYQILLGNNLITECYVNMHDQHVNSVQTRMDLNEHGIWIEAKRAP